jgi:hypothetical protein
MSTSRRPGSPAKASAAPCTDVSSPTSSALPSARTSPSSAAAASAPAAGSRALVARAYRTALQERYVGLGERIAPGRGDELGARLALLVDGMYVNAAHLGPDGPAAAGPALAAALVEAARG